LNRFELQLHLVCVELSHLGGFAHQPVQPVTLFIDDCQQFLSFCIGKPTFAPNW